jgi:hypothetical protein
MQDLRTILEKELTNEKEKLKEDRIQVDQQMRQVSYDSLLTISESLLIFIQFLDRFAI